MKFKDEIVLSATRLSDGVQLVGDEANQAVQNQGLTHIYIDNEGRVHALNNTQEYLNGYFVFKRRIPVLKV